MNPTPPDLSISARDAVWRQFALMSTLLMFSDYCRRQPDPAAHARAVLGAIRERMLEEVPGEAAEALIVIQMDILEKTVMNVVTESNPLP